VELDANWVVGFVDGEGCFHVSVNRHSELTAGFQVLPEFVVVQHERDMQILHALKRFFDSGVVRSNHDDRWCLRIRRLDALQRVCDFFVQHPLKTKKNVDFRKFRRIILMMSDKHHLNRERLLEIVDIALSMNSTNRPKLEEVRHELKCSDGPDKDMVHA
jgi:hypothetical protein